jgi:hypothetical protein
MALWAIAGAQKMDWMAFSICVSVIGLVCGIGFWEKLVTFARGSRSDDQN